MRTSANGAGEFVRKILRCEWGIAGADISHSIERILFSIEPTDIKECDITAFTNINHL
ncbi:hypothetical protein QDD76_004931 [Burkholderia cepacia]|jgi:hypothetical protein|uniref:Uncharacterized protein n=1 Tax=Burkholderia contaminans TaxID=488447 RepID=A0ABD7YHA2_9BURK|nr:MULTISPECIES: hypothetical protein [Burkholderia]EKS9798938.1 hypothetical protein [Burkholderia cepacia]EKS9805892.1 hypothetical protein [Burkholderia cepacia]EKS9813440.1 hypothetical protein [Burkholderia cepacia]EKS9820279.1 hypothetical protein [Burkholderia cepacia]EKS9828144.1 hypothetical protein [Burkholderia cepacia]